MNRFLTTTLVLLFSMAFLPASLQAENPISMIVTQVSASNEGADFNLDNDAYRDKLIKLFSYSTYVQLDQAKVSLNIATPIILELKDDYQIELLLKEASDGKNLITASITKAGKEYLKTDLTIPHPGVIFLGGPQLESGDLILVLETVQ